jgi:exonuclease III
MKYFFRFIIAVCIAGLSALNVQAQRETLKVITYNIWNGFDWGKDADRREKLVNWVNVQQADVVALQELCKYTDEKLAEDAKGWGHNYSVLLKKSGYSVGITSNEPIHIAEKIRDDMHHGALHCRTHGCDFLVVHFSPGNFQKRMQEADIIIQKVNVIKKESDNYMVLGDFNCLSPFDADLYPEHKLSEEDLTNKNYHLGWPDYTVMARYLGVPLMDVCQLYTEGMKERGSFPGWALSKVNGEAIEELKKRMIRIDYILVAPNLLNHCIQAKVLNGDDTAWLSDHYPVMAEFEWTSY